MKKLFVLLILLLGVNTYSSAQEECTQAYFESTMKKLLVPAYQEIVPVGKTIESYFEPNACAKKLDYKTNLPKLFSNHGFTLKWNGKRNGAKEYFIITRHY